MLYTRDQIERAGYRATALHSNKSQGQRQAALDGAAREATWITGILVVVLAFGLLFGLLLLVGLVMGWK